VPGRGVSGILSRRWVDEVLTDGPGRAHQLRCYLVSGLEAESWAEMSRATRNGGAEHREQGCLRMIVSSLVKVVR